jgi:hypothetical protein
MATAETSEPSLLSAPEATALAPSPTLPVTFDAAFANASDELVHPRLPYLARWDTRSQRGPSKGMRSGAGLAAMPLDCASPSCGGRCYVGLGANVLRQARSPLVQARSPPAHAFARPMPLQMHLLVGVCHCLTT